MRILLIGAPGSGKGTQAVRIAERLGITHISSGDLLRQHVTDGTAIGRQVQEYVSHGDLVPDQIVLDMLRKPILAASEAGGYVLDGFPRTVDQAKIAYDTARELGVAVQVAIHLAVPMDDLVQRLLPVAAGPTTPRRSSSTGSRSTRPRPSRWSPTTPTASCSSPSTGRSRWTT